MEDSSGEGDGGRGYRCREDGSMGMAEVGRLATLGGQQQPWVGGSSGEQATRLAIYMNSRGSHEDDVWNKTKLLNKSH